MWFTYSFFKKYLFILERERTCAQCRKGQRERTSSRTSPPHHAEHGVRRGTRSHDPEITTWTEIKSPMLNWLSHSGAPPTIFSRARVESGSQCLSREDVIGKKWGQKSPTESSFKHNELGWHFHTQWLNPMSGGFTTVVWHPHSALLSSLFYSFFVSLLSTCYTEVKSQRV